MKFYAMAAKWYLKNIELVDVSDYTVVSYLIALQTKDFPACEVFRLGEDELNKEFEIISESVKKINWHMENNSWEHKKEYYDGEPFIDVNLE